MVIDMFSFPLPPLPASCGLIGPGVIAGILAEYYLAIHGSLMQTNSQLFKVSVCRGHSM